MQRKFLAPALILVALLTLLAFLGMRAAASTPAMSLAAQQREVYLTFDDGPSTVVTSRVLDVLKEEDVKATFFIVSDRVDGREEVLKRIASEGHTLGVHSATHDYGSIYRSDESLLRDIATCAGRITRLTGIHPTVYRFPGGGLSNYAHKKALVEAQGYRVVGWNAVCGDEEIRNASSQTLFEKAVETSLGKRPVVLLLHDSATHKATAEALPKIIAYFRENGYVFRAY